MESEEQNLIEEVKMNSNKSKYDDLKFLARIILNVTYLLTFVGMIVSVAIAGEVSFLMGFIYLLSFLVSSLFLIAFAKTIFVIIDIYQNTCKHGE